MFRLLYYLYARRLVRDVKSRPTPGHIGIILDGNRRHGRSLGITEPRELYDLGANGASPHSARLRAQPSPPRPGTRMSMSQKYGEPVTKIRI